MKHTARQPTTPVAEIDIRDVPGAAGADETTLVDHWRLIVRHRWGILGIACAAVLIGALIAFSTTPVYKASVTLLVEPIQPKVVNLQPLDGAPPLTLFYETQYEIIRSRAIAETVVDKLGLVDNDLFRGGSDAGLMSKARAWLSDAPETADDARLRSAAVARLQKHLSVHGGQKSQIVIVNYQSTNAELAAQIVNAVAQAYSEYGMESRVTRVKEATAWLSERLTGLRGQLAQSEAALAAYQSRESMVDTENRRHMINARIASLTAELVKAQAERSAAHIRHQQVQRLIEEGRGYEGLIPILGNKLIDQLSIELGALRQKFSELNERYGEKHPKIIAAKADLEEASRRLEREARQAVNSIRKEYEAAQAREDEANRQLEQQQAEMRNLTGKSFDLAKLEREVESNRQLYETFLARFKEIDTAGEGSATNVRVVDPAQPPRLPFKPDKKRIIVMSLILGLLLGVAAALLREKLDNTFKRNEDVERRLMLPVLAQLTLLETQTGKSVVPERDTLNHPRSAFAEAVHNVRTSVLFSNLDQPVRTLMITSSMPGEGKTTLAFNLAIAFSRLGRTLLLDGDMRKPAIQRVAKLGPGAGFTEWLLGTETLDACYREDKKCRNLFIMPTGKIPPNPLELLSSRTFQQSFETLKQEFEYIIVDMAPVLPVSDPIVVGHLVDAVIFSVRFDATTHPMAQEALKRLRANHIEPVGAVLSLVDTKILKSYYGRDYYGGYYGGDYATDTTGRKA